MSGAVRFVWIIAAVMVATALVGFATIAPDTPVPHQFDLDGWSTFSSRNTALGLFTLAALIAAAVLTWLLASYPHRWLRLSVCAFMCFLAGAEIAAIAHAS